MAQFLRVCKPEICSAVRSYGTQRYQQNYYEILDVPPTASQKDIRKAFIKLSKQLHPDTSGKHSHSDFVKLNEAYTVLAKKDARRRYDFDLKYKCDPCYAYRYTPQYGSRWEYEVRTAGGPWPPPNEKPNGPFGLAVALLFFSMGLFQFFYILHSAKVRNHLRSNIHTHLQHEYQHTHDLTCTELNNAYPFTSGTNLNEVSVFVFLHILPIYTTGN